MEHLQIAYDLLVIMIGLAALAIVVFWAMRTGETDLRDFSILYLCFTLVLVVVVMKKYLSVNVADYSAQAWYWLSGMELVLNHAVIVSGIFFFTGIYQLRHRKAITTGFLLLMLVSTGLLFSPVGAVLEAGTRTIHFGIGFKVVGIGYFLAFTGMLAIGYGFLRSAWHTKRRDFLIGLLLFASMGYLETAIHLPGSLSQTAVTRSQGDDFLYSSIPYALYGAFLISYFLQHPAPAAQIMDTVPESFLTKYAITDREREIILKVMQGKSNADIAAELVISLATVKTHLHNIYTKIGVDSRFDLLARVRSGK